MTFIPTKLLSIRPHDDNDYTCGFATVVPLYKFKFLNKSTNKIHKLSLELFDFLTVLDSLNNIGDCTTIIEYARNHLREKATQIVLELCQQGEIVVVLKDDDYNFGPISLSGNLLLLKHKIGFIVYDHFFDGIW